MRGQETLPERERTSSAKISADDRKLRRRPMSTRTGAAVRRGHHTPLPTVGPRRQSIYFGPRRGACAIPPRQPHTDAERSPNHGHPTEKPHVAEPLAAASGGADEPVDVVASLVIIARRTL